MGERQFICHVCDKIFISSFSLKRHAFIHTVHRQFTCQICNKTFVNASYLRRHELIHSNVRRYIFQSCDKCFTTSSIRHQHELIHKDECTYVCKTCNKRFKQANGLYQHQRYHCTQRCEQTEMRHVRQIRCLVYVCCECHQLFYHRLNSSELIFEFVSLYIMNINLLACLHVIINLKVCFLLFY